MQLDTTWYFRIMQWSMPCIWWTRPTEVLLSQMYCIQIITVHRKKISISRDHYCRVVNTPIVVDALSSGSKSRVAIGGVDLGLTGHVLGQIIFKRPLRSSHPISSDRHLTRRYLKGWTELHICLFQNDCVNKDGWDILQMTMKKDSPNGCANKDCMKVSMDDNDNGYSRWKGLSDKNVTRPPYKLSNHRLAHTHTKLQS